jgi:ATP-binding cassette subfamily B protein
MIGFIGRLFGFIRPHRPLYLLTLLCMLLQLVYQLYIPVALRRLFDEGLLAGNAGVVTVTLALLCLGFAGHAGATVAQDWFAARVAAGALHRLRERMYASIQRLGADYLATHGTADIASRFTADLAAVELAMVRGLPGLVLRLILMAGSIVTACLLDWRLALATFIVLPLCFLAPRPLTPRAMAAAYARRADDARLAAMVQETLALSRVIRTFRLQADRSAAFDRLLAAVDASSIRGNFLANLAGRLTTVGVSFLLLMVIGLGTILALHGFLSPGVVLAFILILLNIGAGASGLAEALPLLIQGHAGLKRIDEMLAAAAPPETAVAARGAAIGRFASLAFEQVSFSYGGGQRNLDDVSFSIDLPRSVAFVGPSGAGKSTVLNLLLRHHEAEAGRILVSGTDIRQLSDEELRTAIGVVSQDTALFQMSIAENIRMGRPDAPLAAVIEAAKAAEIHDTIMAMPEGYDTDVGELGGNLSAGQRQRIALARALLRQPEVLVLDEVTSALDPATENAINHTLMRLRGDRTILAVTHRLHQAAGMDEILVMDGGRLVERGGHEALLAKGGLYAELWAKQSGLVLSEDGRTATITVERLAAIPFFAGLSPETLQEVVRSLHMETAEPGTELLTERAVDGAFHIIVRGIVDLSVTGRDGQPIRLESLEIGDFFGEIALLQDVPQVATARVRTPATLLVMHRDQFIHLLGREPLLHARAVEIIDRRMQSKLDELVYRRLGLAEAEAP